MNEEKIKLYILTGFLGAGKTTTLQKLLLNEKGKKIGVIQNEFGKISIDGQILGGGDFELVDLSNGSIFCTCLQLNFVQALAEMSKHGLDAVYVESSGLADPSNLFEVLEAAAVLMGEQRYQLCGTICLVDPVSFLKEAADLEAVARQIIHCNIALINKCDLADRQRLDEVSAEIRRLNPDCLVVETVGGVMEETLLQQDLSTYGWAPSQETTINASTRPKTFSISTEADIPADKLEAFLKAVLPECYRIKGFCLTDGSWQQVDVVTDRIDYRPCPAKEKTVLVFISRVSIQLLRTIDTAWKQLVGLPVQLHN